MVTGIKVLALCFSLLPKAEADTLKEERNGLVSALLLSNSYRTEGVPVTPWTGGVLAYSEVSTKGKYICTSESAYLYQGYWAAYPEGRTLNKLHSVGHLRQFKKRRKALDTSFGYIITLRVSERREGQSFWWLFPYPEAGLTGGLGKTWSPFSTEFRVGSMVLDIRGFKPQPSKMYNAGIYFTYVF